jgi:Arm DNA-binding domain
MKPTKLLSSRRAIAALEPKGQPYTMWAGDLPGFGLRVHPTGVKTFILRYRPRGAGRSSNQRTLTLGRFPALTPEQARDLATAALAKVASGGDPAQEAKLLRERPAPTTVGEVLEAYHRSLEGRASYRVFGSDIRLHLKPALGKIPASELTAQDVRKLSDKLTKQGKRTRAGACVRLLRAAYRRAMTESCGRAGR